MLLDSNDAPLVKVRKDNIGVVSMVVFLTDFAIGTGVTKLGPSYKCGWLNASIISTCYAVLAFFSLRLLFKACEQKGKGSVELLSAELFSRNISLFFSVFSTLGFLGCVFVYIKFIQTSLSSVINYFAPGLNQLITNPYTTSLIFFILLFMPFSFVQQLKIMKWVSISKMVLICAVSASIIAIFGLQTKRMGWNPHNDIEMSSTNNLITCLSTFSAAYLIQPISYPSLSHLYNCSRKRANRVALYFTILTWLIYNILGLAEYFTLTNRNMGDVFFEYFPMEPVVIFGKFSLILMMLCSIILATNTIRNCIIRSIVATDGSMDNIIWGWTGLIIVLSLIFLTQAPSIVGTIINGITDFASPLNFLVQPAILYIAACWKLNKVYDVIAVISIIIGCACSILFIYQFALNFV